MNQELKQQAHKEFMNEFREDIYKTAPTDMDVKIEKVFNFIDSVIDKTVQMTEEYIEIINKRLQATLSPER